MASLTEKLNRKLGLTAGGARKKNPSGRGKGIWQTQASLDNYRLARNKARKVAKESRRRNRG